MTPSFDERQFSQPIDIYAGNYAADEPPAPLAPLEPGYRPTKISLFPVALFCLTCYTTFQVGSLDFWMWFADEGATSEQAHLWAGLWYSVPLMATLLCHEFGHFIQSRRYRVTASWPYFIPIPMGPIGTMGAVIGMRGHMGNRRALFDIGISGPLAGLVPALTFSVVGLSMSRLGNIVPGLHQSLGEPLLFQWLTDLFFGPREPGTDVFLHPMAFAGWVGIFITALNLMPIGQLDGGHVLYALLRQKAHVVAQLLLLAAVAGVVMTGNYEWSLMLVLLVLMGPKHPPTADDEVPLGRGRTILGWLTLMFVIIGFTPRPFM